MTMTARIATENRLKYKSKSQRHLKITPRKTEAGSRLSFEDNSPGVSDYELP